LTNFEFILYFISGAAHPWAAFSVGPGNLLITAFLGVVVGFVSSGEREGAAGGEIGFMLSRR
jgi:hypothetical protein